MQYFSYVLSLISVLSIWLMGNKSIYGVILGIINQMLWVIYALSLKEYGLLIGVVAYTIVQVRNLIKWINENKQLERIN